MHWVNWFAEIFSETLTLSDKQELRKASITETWIVNNSF